MKAIKSPQRVILTIALLFILVAIHVSVSVGGTTSPLVVRINNPTPNAGDLFGKAVAGLEDIDGDGVGDLAVGAPGTDKVYLLSGDDPSDIIHTISDPEGLSGYWFGRSVCGVGDFDNDGIEDVAVGAPGIPGVAYAPCPITLPDSSDTPGPECYANMGRVFVFSGATGQMIIRIGNTSQSEPEFPKRYLGWTIAPLGDIDNSPDGVPDLAISAPVFDEPSPRLGTVYAVSGADGLLMWEREEPESALGAEQELASFGWDMAGILDLTPSGTRNLLVSTPFFDCDSGEGISLCGKAYVLDGWDGDILRTHSNPTETDLDYFGQGVGVIGDQDGDGVKDYAFGEVGASMVHLYSGQTGALLNQIMSPSGGSSDSFGFQIAGMDDKDANGWDDFWIAAREGGKVYLMDKSGNVIEQVDDPAPSFPGYFGDSLAPTADLDGDDSLDLVIGKPNESAGGLAEVGAAFLVLGVKTEPDMYDDPSQTGKPRNDTFSNASLIPDMITASPLIMTGQINNLNFDTSSDIDYFTVELDSATDEYGNPECCSSSDSYTIQGKFEIRVDPTAMRPFEITIYYPNGAVYAMVLALDYTLYCPHDIFPSGFITFSVRDPKGRNSYNLGLGYNRCDKELPIPPDWLTDPEPPLFNRPIPPWMDNVLLRFPLNPEVVNDYFGSEPTGPPFPAEYMLFEWRHDEDYQVDITFPQGGDLSVMLLDEAGEELAEAAWMSPYKRLEVPGLTPGLYFLMVEGGAFGTYYVLDSIIDVYIDIKPGSYPNAINLGSRGMIPVAILSSEDFDAINVDPDTVTLAGSGVAVRGKGTKSMAHIEDTNGDGLDDLVVQIETSNLDPGAFQGGTAILTGETYDCRPFEGSDEINIVPE